MTDFYVAISLNEALRLIDNEIHNSITGETLDRYTAFNDGGRSVIVSVYEKHYYRAGNRLTLTVTVDNCSGRTHVHTVGGGGGQGLFRFDWGAGDSFEDCVTAALRKYIIG